MRRYIRFFQKQPQSCDVNEKDVHVDEDERIDEDVHIDEDDHGNVDGHEANVNVNEDNHDHVNGNTNVDEDVFASSTKRWHIFKEHVKGLTVKPLSATRWESRVKNVKPIRFQLSDVREALLEIRDTDGDPMTTNDANSLSKNELSDFEFIVSILIWYEILNMMNVVSKKLQSKDMIIDVAIDQVKKLVTFFKEFREVGLSNAINEAEKIATELDVDPVFKQRRHIRRKKQFDETSNAQEVVFSPEEDFKVNYFLCIVDQAISSLEKRFEQYQEYEKLFDFLFPKKLRELGENDLKSCCYCLQDALKNGEESDIDAEELYVELKLFETFLSKNIISPLDALNNLKQVDSYPNALVAYRVLLTIPVIVASAERSFSKLKLLKAYLRSLMSQERLNGIAIENDVLETLDYKELIESFASKNARIASRFI